MNRDWSEVEWVRFSAMTFRPVSSGSRWMNMLVAVSVLFRVARWLLTVTFSCLVTVLSLRRLLVGRITSESSSALSIGRLKCRLAVVLPRCRNCTLNVMPRLISMSLVVKWRNIGRIRVTAGPFWITLGRTRRTGTFVLGTDW